MDTDGKENKQSNSSEENNENELPQVNALFVCPICGGLTLILSDSWTQSMNGAPDLSPTPKTRRPAELISYSKSFSYKKNDMNWTHYKKFQEFNEFFDSTKLSVFPYCNSCSSNILQSIRKKSGFLNYGESLFLRLDITDKFIFANTLKEEIEKIINEKNAFLEAKTEYEKETNRLKTQGGKRRNSSYLTKGYVEGEINSSALVPKTSGPPRAFSSLTSCMIFHISYNRFYGTINTLRLGQNISREVPYEEINNGFTMLFHLISSMCRIGNIDCSNLTNGIPLTIDGTVLNAADTTYRKGVVVFNQAITKLFAFCSSLFMNSIVGTHSLTPPFIINTEENTISQESFLFDAKNPDGWTRAMKLLLFNFKFIQMKMLKGTRIIPSV
ncbi:hypothetical protein TVAG_335940 [Trichomonas vaginalis G3]|uniref:Atg6 BARA domain-containing protein n=1 Tax=Trichomonas vaginalis (strain ATCC PRA-98 / G3) TaxID=412133 RepID=A2FQ97_TRIV3|nr:beclin 1 family [Trichomonas vaginalis G3]EAX92932.1 hypothetical protein TVAG_335940 [Trichomonas vaginalis G3]KAI5510113.1 beclin 1 family [Trichomonas vaginalis G3]|eukprot:XP_001305862.1 hypothetical protein [Trichomonas vaginalis G3]